jgi:hypothetical protein
MHLLNHNRSIVLIIMAIFLGWLGWNTKANAFVFLPLIIWIWAHSPNKLAAFNALFAYYLAASHGLLTGANVFFHNPFVLPSWWTGIAVWIVPNLVLAAVWGMLWSVSQQGIRLIFLLVLISLPPLGIIGWANPLTAAGALFPSTGWVGLILLIIFLVTLAQTSDLRFVIPFILTSFVMNITQTKSLEAINWHGIDTYYLPSKTLYDEFRRMHSLQSRIEKESLSSPEGTIFLLPEAVGGDWNVNAIWWDKIAQQLKARRQTALIGVNHREKEHSLINKLTSIGFNQNIEFFNRVPVPLGMWRPYRDDSTKAFWWASGIAKMQNKKIASLICYEQLLIWPVLISMAAQPDILIGASNDWWARRTTIPDIQRHVTLTWGRLFQIPVVYAANL